MKFHFVFVGALCLAALMAASSYAGVAINGTTITFSDSTMQSTAQIVGPQGPKGDKGDKGNQGDPGADGADGSDANVPAGHGGSSNSVNGTDSFIGGGRSNLVTDDYGTIGAGQGNQAGDNTGGPSNMKWATVGGGLSNMASGSQSTVGGGDSNTASGTQSTVGGGRINTASGDQSTVAGGKSNTASGHYSTASGGWSNMASGHSSTVSGGWDNTASGSRATVSGGRNNTASGDYSFVAGLSANDGGYDNVFVWDDGTGYDATAADTFNVNASGGIYLNGGVQHSSDRNMKEAFSFVSAREVLEKVVHMPVSTWRFKSEDDSVRHIGPVAQDFMAAFGYGVNDTHITATDADGVALAAIQGLNAKLEAKRAEDAEVITALRWHNAQLAARLARLENFILRESVSQPAGTG